MSLHLPGRRRIYLTASSDSVFSFVSEHQTVEEFWKTSFVTFALRTASLDGSRPLRTAKSNRNFFGPVMDTLGPVMDTLGPAVDTLSPDWTPRGVQHGTKRTK